MAFGSGMPLAIFRWLAQVCIFYMTVMAAEYLRTLHGPGFHISQIC